MMFESLSSGNEAVRDPLLEVEDLIVEFHTRGGIVRAVNGVSFHIRNREAVAVVGESGSGKSVTALAVMGLLRSPPARVSFSVLGFAGHPLPHEEARRMREIRGGSIGIVFQDPARSLNPVMSIGDQLTQVLRAHGIGDSSADRRRRAIEMLERVRLPEPESRIDDYPHQFSGGMCQRALIAMALCCGPKLLIADEPTTGLDVTVQAQILDLLRELQEEMDMSILLITHDLGVVAGFAERIHVMYAGMFVEVGSVREVLGSPDHPYTRALLKSVPTQTKDKGDLLAIPGAPPLPTDLPSGCPFRPRCSIATERCLHMPPVVDLGPGHYAQCWYADKSQTNPREEL